MTRELFQVLQFHEAFKMPIGQKPEPIADDRAEMRQRILQEEIDELAKAVQEKDMVEIADGVCDAIYILLGTAIEYGFYDRLEQMFSEVHRSNMSKLKDGQPVYREDGKVIKGPDFSPPDLGQFLK